MNSRPSPTDREAAIIRSALGLLYAKKPYRNHYCAPAGGEVRDLLESMADRGLVERGCQQPSGLRFYFVTEAGAASCGHQLPED